MERRQLDRIEDMLSNLITVVGNINERLQGSLEDQAAVREMQSVFCEEQRAMRDEQQEIKKEQSIMMSILIDMQADQEHIWEKAARNERELAKLKKHIQL